MPLRLAPKPPDIGPLDGFSKSDIFEAKDTGERLANIVADVQGHSVLVIDGPWGTGKSVFVQQWAGLLRKRGHTVVYFDAFTHDHLDDAFFPLLGQLLRARQDTGGSSDQRKTLIKKAGLLVRTIPALLADAAVRKATGGTMTSGDLTEMLAQSAATKKNRAQLVVEDCIDHAEDYAECVEHFRQEIEGFIAAESSGDVVGNQAHKLPLVFVIDELDRCRPTYALSLLERMKHLFSVDSVCFVMVTHLNGLQDMVRRAYGICKPDVYLEKFYNVRFDFEKLLLQGSDNLRQRYLDHLANEFSIERKPNTLATTTIDNLTRIYNVSLRGQEKIMVNYALFFSSISSRRGFNQLPIILASGLSVMRHIDRKLFLRASSENVGFSDIGRFFRFEDWIDITEHGLGELKACWIAELDDGADGYVLHLREIAKVCAEIDQLGS